MSSGTTTAGELNLPLEGASRPRGRGIYPSGTTNVNWFSLFNSLSWQITLGAPIVLYAKQQGASATVLGVMAALTPLLVIFQLPAAHLLPKYGYRRFILAGWGTRTVMIFAMAAVPLLPAGPTMKLAILIFCLFIFNLVRGVTSGAWWPWLTELIPQELRGRFLARDQVFAQVGALSSLTTAALLLRGDAAQGARPSQFAVVFLFSAIAQTISLLFVRRVPDITAPERMQRSSHRVPWKQMLRWPPFLRLVVFNLLWVFAVGGLGVFTVAFLRSVAQFSQSRILILTALSFVGALCVVPWAGRAVDREGSRPMLRLSIAVCMAVLAGWWLLASGVIGQPVVLVGLLNLLLGAVGASFTVANWRLSMATMPVMGRNHFFAMFTVITNAGLGLAPILWGALIDALHGLDAATGPFAWNRYSIYFAAACLLSAATLAYSVRIREGDIDSQI